MITGKKNFRLSTIRKLARFSMLSPGRYCALIEPFGSEGTGAHAHGVRHPNVGPHSSYGHVTGVSTHFELSPDDVKRFCHNRIPDGVIRLTQEGQDFELAVELESSVRNAARVSEVLENYWQTFRRGMECLGLVLVSLSPTITAMYTKALQAMPEEFQARAKLLEGMGLNGLRAEAFGERTDDLSRCLDLTRTSFLGEIRYSPIKSGTCLAQAACYTPTQAGVGQPMGERSFNENLQ